MKFGNLERKMVTKCDATILLLLFIISVTLQTPHLEAASSRHITTLPDNSTVSYIQIYNSTTINNDNKNIESTNLPRENKITEITSETNSTKTSFNTTKNEDIYDTNDYHGNLSRETIAKIRKCEQNQERMELCMRCAKITKAVIVYPLCCNDEDNVKQWCHDYVYFGIGNT